MRINHNLAALNTLNQLSKNSTLTSNSLSKLSSGLQINKAGDDAAGLSISEKMRAQIRGLEQASSNAQDGISLIQTAEGALNETTSILQRMRELAVQASNDTSTSDDRARIQEEMDQLAKEVTRISDTTKFNGKDLMSSTGTFSGNFLIGSDSGQTLSVSLSAMDTVTLGVGTNAVTAAAFDEVALVAGDGDEFLAGGVDVSGYSQTNDLEIKIEVTTEGTAGAAAVANITINGVTVSALDADAVGAATPSWTLDATNWDLFETGQSVVITGAATPTVGDEVNIKITGAQNGIAGLDVSTDGATAESQISTIDSALTAVSAERSKLGSYQNRLEHTITNLGTSAENLTAAESRIRDVDMAKEMMQFTKNNILSQAAQAMLAQANQQPQAVLQLLR